MIQTKILIVEDEAIVARDIAQQLAQLGYDPVGQTSLGEQALELVRQLRPDLVLMDIRLSGGMDGIGTAQIIRERHAIPVVFLTAFADDETLERAKRAEPCGYIIKPFKKRDLRTVIEMALYKSEAEARLQESEEKYRLLLDSSGIGVGYYSIDGKILLFNREAAQRLQGKPEDFIGKSILEVFERPAADEYLRRIQATAASGELQEHEDFVHLPSGTAWFLADYARVTNSRGEVIGVQVVARDITERKRAETQIRHLNEVLRVVRDVGKIIVRERHPEKLLTEACNTLLHTRGYRLAWIAGIVPDSKQVIPIARASAASDYLDVVTITWDENATGRGPIGTALRERRVCVCQDTATDPDFALWREPALTRGYRSLAAVPVVHGDRLYGAIGVYADRPGAFDEEEIRLLDELASDIGFALQAMEADQERKRAEEAIRHAKIAAEAANHAKSEFLANMSHEIRTPMTAILGYTDLLMDDRLDAADRQAFLATVRRNGEHLLQLINDILDLSKIEAERLRLEQVDWPLRQVIDEVGTLLSVRANQKHLKLEITYEEPLPTLIRTDPARLRQILLNLVGNAIKFTDAGGVRITVHCNQEEDLRSQIRIDVVDSGIGIRADAMQTLFEPFTQADMSLTRRFGGTGLGLNISQKLAHMLGGRIEVQSELGKGSTFTLAFDARTTTDAESSPSASTASRQDPNRPPGDVRQSLRGRVLLVEDVAEIACLVRWVLAKTHLELDVAENGATGYDMAMAARAADKPYHLILMDIRMPVMNGYDTTRRLRASGWQGPIVAMTAHSMREDRQQCLDAGCNDYLSKPVNQVDFFRVLARYLSPDTPKSMATFDRELSAAPPRHVALFDGLLDDATVEQLVDEYTDTLLQKADAIEKAYIAHDFELLAELAHGLKGVAHMYGFARVSEMALCLSQLVVQGDNAGQLQATICELACLCRKEAGVRRSKARKASNESNQPTDRR